jgi:O-antigen ligase
MSAQQPSNGAPAVVVAPGASTPATDADYQKLKDQFDKTATNNLGRWVALGTAALVPFVTALCAWLQKKIGIKLDPAALVAFITSMAGGIVITAYKWLSNHGSWERATVEGYKVYLTGQAATSSQVVVAPPAAGAATPPGGPLPPPHG